MPRPAPPAKAAPAGSADKAALKAELLAQLTAALDGAQRAHAAALEGATHSEARAENDKDTRGLEQSYLARGQAQRVAELEAAIVLVGALALRAFAAGDPIALGALVTIDEDGGDSGDAGEAGEDAGPRRLFVAPHGGGSALAGGIQVVTPSSPLGRALLGKRVDDEVELRLPGKQRTLLITAIA
ncbi:MAG TPA: GreA/GreB family elongation factor [Kofleriaceae bacterium]|nr:GreA/GreB family elongation factor [Kofleriaceae bacterium]